MIRVELIYDEGCPNVVAVRTRLMAAFAHAEIAPRWSEQLAHARGLASPTIMIDGHALGGAAPAAGASCRLYTDERGATSGMPPLDLLVDALRDASSCTRPAGRCGVLAMLPAIGAALLPKVACPACWPAYAGVLGALGLGFLMETAVLLPLTAAFLGIAVGALGWRAGSRRGLRPLGLGVLAAAIVLVGKFGFESDAAMYAGLGLLVAASLWNSWPRERAAGCPSCSPRR